MNGWVVTWVGIGGGVDPKKVVAVFNYRYRSSTIRDQIEQLCMILAPHTDEDKLRYAKSAKSNPYPSKADVFGCITCGDNPWLYARQVSDIRPDGNGSLTWVEPDIEKMENARRRLLGD